MRIVLLHAECDLKIAGEVCEKMSECGYEADRRSVETLPDDCGLYTHAFILLTQDGLEQFADDEKVAEFIHYFSIQGRLFAYATERFYFPTDISEMLKPLTYCPTLRVEDVAGSLSAVEGDLRYNGDDKFHYHRSGGQELPSHRSIDTRRVRNKSLMYMLIAIVLGILMITMVRLGVL